MEMSSKNQHERQISQDQEKERLRLIGMGRTILQGFSEETAQNAMKILNWCVNTIEANLKAEIEQRLIKDACKSEMK